MIDAELENLHPVFYLYVYLQDAMVTGENNLYNNSSSDDEVPVCKS